MLYIPVRNDYPSPGLITRIQKAINFTTVFQVRDLNLHKLIYIFYVKDI
jgi:hypothetical protein